MSFIPTIMDQALETYLQTMLGMPVYAGNIPQLETNYPAIVYTLIYSKSYNNLGGSAGLVSADYQIDIYGDDALAVEQAFETLRSALESYRGLMGNVFVTGARIVDTNQSDEEPPNGSDSWIYRIMTEWTITYQQSIPTF